MNRREFLRNSSGIVLAGAMPALAQSALHEEVAGSPLSPWREGQLDLHHINTGRGNSTLAVMPDGTSLLIDAGSVGTLGPAVCEAKPNDSRRPGEWIARYIERQLRAAGIAKAEERARVDYALMTHLHGDHVGDMSA